MSSPLDPLIYELWEALVCSFPGSARKAGMNRGLCVSYMSGKNLGGEEMNRLRLESLWTPVCSGLLLWWCHLHIRIYLSCYHYSAETVLVKTSESPLWLTVCTSYQQPYLSFCHLVLSLFLPSLCFFIFLSTELSSLCSSVLILLAHSAVHWWLHIIMWSLDSALCSSRLTWSLCPSFLWCWQQLSNNFYHKMVV